MIIKYIDENQINIILNEITNSISKLSCPESFFNFSKNIYYSPKIISEIFGEEYLITNYLDNINLLRYWTDILVYNINRTDRKEMISKIKKNNIIDNFINSDIFITKNDYPYTIPNTNYKTFIIWNIANNQIDINDISSFIELKDKQWIIWKNPPIYKSIKDIEHYHVMIRPVQSKFKLTRLYIIQRHGPREPIMIPPKFIKNYWDNSNLDHKSAVQKANLTPLGRLYCQFIGSLIYANYSDCFDFNLLNNSNALFGSTDFQRTIETSILTIDGMGLNKICEKLNIVDFIGSDTVFNSEQRKNYYNKLGNPNIKWSKDLDNLNKQIFRLTGSKVSNFSYYFELASTMKCYEFHNYKMLENDTDNQELQDIKNTVYNLSTYYYNEVHNPENTDNTETTLLGKNACEKILELFSSSQYKFVLLTTHDNMIMPIVKNIIYGVFNNDIEFDGLNYDKKYFNENVVSKIKLLQFPDFNSNIRFELWEDDYGKKIIRIYYSSLFLFEFS